MAMELKGMIEEFASGGQSLGFAMPGSSRSGGPRGRVMAGALPRWECPLRFALRQETSKHLEEALRLQPAIAP